MEHVKMTTVRLAIVFLSLPLRAYADTNPQPQVRISTGELQGTRLTCRGCPQTVLGFLGVPYAQPPVGALRFKPPRPAEAWDDVLDGTKYRDVCPQNLQIMSVYQKMPAEGLGTAEDCLHLNVYTPSLDGSRPVLIWIHGGGLLFGGGLYNDGTPLASYEDLVVVTINYRLAELGHFMINDNGKVVPGSLSIRDQREALRWVHNNVHYFGGDPDQVTISGHSAGALSVSWHLLSTAGTRKLFRRSILHSTYSAPPLPHLSFDSKVKEYAKTLECEAETHREIGRCLRDAPIEELMAATAKVKVRVDWRAYQDPKIVPRDLREAYSKLNSTTGLEVLIGVTSDEGFVLSPIAWPEVMSDTLNYDQCVQLVPRFFKAYYPDSIDVVAKEIVDFYLGNSPYVKDKKNRGALKIRMAEMFGDFYMSSGTYYEALRYSALLTPVYFYEFSHQAWFVRPQRPPGHNGCDHGFDIQFFYGFPYLNYESIVNSTYTEEEEQLARVSMRYLSNFVKTGNPNGEDLQNWPRFEPGVEKFLRLQPQLAEGARYRHERIAFWNDHIPNIVQKAAQHKPRDEL